MSKARPECPGSNSSDWLATVEILLRQEPDEEEEEEDDSDNNREDYDDDGEDGYSE
jgi:hypothetical protein